MVETVAVGAGVVEPLKGREAENAPELVCDILTPDETEPGVRPAFRRTYRVCKTVPLVGATDWAAAKPTTLLVCDTSKPVGAFTDTLAVRLAPVKI